MNSIDNPYALHILIATEAVARAVLAAGTTATDTGELVT